MTWGKMDAAFVADIWGQIYDVKVRPRPRADLAGAVSAPSAGGS